jgi:glutathione peroxidase
MTAPAFYDIPVHRIDGSRATLAEHRGSVLLIVNVASQCGLTPQYASLEELHETYGPRGLRVLGFPSNDFAGQEPGTEDEIKSFCETAYGVKFPLYSKIVVKGPGRHPLYQALTEARPDATSAPGSGLRDKLAQRGLLSEEPGAVMWNFEKFLLDRQGEIVGRFAPDVTPNDPVLVAAIEKALAA